VICSTPYLARRYRSFNDRTWACRNGIDLKRYAWPKPPRQGVTIGWAGGIGHVASLARWEPAVRAVMRARPETRFVSVGHPFADELVPEFGRERALGLPPAKIEVYPASMTLFDVAIAPSAENNLFRGKSDLRWLEASALRLPLVAHPDVYPEIEDGVTGVHARTPAEAEAALLRLVDDAALRERIGAAAHAHVAAHRRADVTAEDWRTVLTEVAAPVAR
jgi:glycosyltransferase involved in cell wall biosynthesis